MPFVKCSVDGCSQKLQPILKVDPRDRETWFYRECDVCLRLLLWKSIRWKLDNRLICDRCRRESEAKQQQAGLIELGIRRRPDEAGPE